MAQVSRELLTKHATNAPRYTSYPTAVDWSKEFEGSAYPELLAQAATRSGPLSVYVHLPFCAELCLFCGCNMVVSRNVSRIDDYLDCLEIEFETVGKSGVGSRVVRQYHWGGGTPTQLNLEQIERVQRAFSRWFRFSPDAEVGLEVDPRVTTREQIRLLAQLGFNRISLGVQDFDPQVQQAIKRVQSEAETRAVVDAAREYGMGSVNIDLIYGLPHQNEAGFERTVERVLAIRPERVALFHYAHVPWMKGHQEAMDASAMPSSEVKLSIFLRAIEQFRGAGYEYIGLDHFALPSDEMAIAHREHSLGRNFMGYTTKRGDDMISLGVSSIGDVSGCFVQNSPKELEYKALVRERGFATHRGHRLTPEDQLRRDVILALMCNGRIDKGAVEARHGIAFDPYFARELSELIPLEEDGLLRCESNELVVTELGQLFLRNVALPFDRYYAARKAAGGGAQTFSRTV
ncbi:MAG: oxygen-independent coproporphyrinogen III oxidase [Planctomycetia bacterium]